MKNPLLLPRDPQMGRQVIAMLAGVAVIALTLAAIFFGGSWIERNW